jgi:hypothetical protein
MGAFSLSWSRRRAKKITFDLNILYSIAAAGNRSME